MLRLVGALGFAAVAARADEWPRPYPGFLQQTAASKALVRFRIERLLPDTASGIDPKQHIWRQVRLEGVVTHRYWGSEPRVGDRLNLSLAYSSWNQYFHELEPVYRNAFCSGPDAKGEPEVLLGGEARAPTVMMLMRGFYGSHAPDTSAIKCDSVIYAGYRAAADAREDKAALIITSLLCRLIYGDLRGCPEFVPLLFDDWTRLYPKLPSSSRSFRKIQDEFYGPVLAASRNESELRLPVTWLGGLMSESRRRTLVAGALSFYDSIPSPPPLTAADSLPKGPSDEWGYNDYLRLSIEMARRSIPKEIDYLMHPETIPYSDRDFFLSPPEWAYRPDSIIQVARAFARVPVPGHH